MGQETLAVGAGFSLEFQLSAAQGQEGRTKYRPVSAPIQGPKWQADGCLTSEASHTKRKTQVKLDKVIVRR